MYDPGRVFPATRMDPETGRVVLAVELPLYLRGSQNLREHWRTRARRVRNERQTTALLVGAAIKATGFRMQNQCITITRYGSLLIRDEDNLLAACKSCRDGIADALGIDDGDQRFTWKYAQGSSRRGKERVEVEIS